MGKENGDRYNTKYIVQLNKNSAAATWFLEDIMLWNKSGTENTNTAWCHCVESEKVYISLYIKVEWWLPGPKVCRAAKERKVSVERLSSVHCCGAGWW